MLSSSYIAARFLCLSRDTYEHCYGDSHANRDTSKLARVKLMEIKACDGKATSNRNNYVALRPQRTGELGADPDTAIYLEPPRRLFLFVKGRRAATGRYTNPSIDSSDLASRLNEAAHKLPAQLESSAWKPFANHSIDRANTGNESKIVLAHIVVNQRAEAERRS